MMHDMDGGKQRTSVVGGDSPIQDIGTYIGTYIARSRVMQFSWKEQRCNLIRSEGKDQNSHTPGPGSADLELYLQNWLPTKYSMAE